MNSFSKLWLSSASLFDPIQNGFNGEFWKVFEKKFAKFAQGKKVLDLACGTGELRNYINPKKYLGIDMNSSYIGYAKSRFKDSKTSFLDKNITKYIPPNFDVAFLISAAHHLSNSNLNLLSLEIKRSQIKTFVVVDGYPKGLLAGILAWFDGILARGKYFRGEKEIAKILGKKLRVERIGRFKARKSFYQYSYVILTNK